MGEVWSVSNRGMRKFLHSTYADATPTGTVILSGNYVYTGRNLPSFAKEVLVDDTTLFYLRGEARCLLNLYLESRFIDRRYEKCVLIGEMMGAGEGWIGPVKDVLYALDLLGADQDGEGKYLVSGQVGVFLGGARPDADILIAEDAQYFVKGQGAQLAAYMRSTSYGVGLKIY